MDNLIIIGVSETAERVYEFVNRYKLFNVIGFAVDFKFKKADKFCDKPIWCLDELDQHINKANDYLLVAIFWNRLNADRRFLYERLKSLNYKFANLISPLASVRGDIVGDNCWIMDYVVIQEKAKIHNNVFIADFAFIGHLAVVLPHVFISARSNVLGSSCIGKQTFIGANASVFDDTNIGEKCLIGACTIVKRNIPAYSMVKTDNELVVVKQYTEDVIETKMIANHNVR